MRISAIPDQDPEELNRLYGSPARYLATKLGVQIRYVPAASFALELRAGAPRGVLLALRALPPPVWAFIFLFVLFPGVVPGALALGVGIGVLGVYRWEVTIQETVVVGLVAAGGLGAGLAQQLAASTPGPPERRCSPWSRSPG